MPVYLPIAQQATYAAVSRLRIIIGHFIEYSFLKVLGTNILNT
ncbi:hypothetical protein MTBBW1_1740007 [Desulfamplus magnetovallimortis]|uniref:Uncharacterized protein n=1 Tax=Desulfamplus magnetovallimortis TaxID=1246637 RepID=A0A1W1H9Y3_9BACT|nr:hypothetical protein MTBBW1_1740007 [Desulfamplus magnetovallimortis]